MLETKFYLSEHPSQESLDTVLDKARTAANRLESFLHRKNSDAAPSHDHDSITSELMNLREHEEALRRELEDVALDAASCATEVLCTGSFDEDDKVVDCLGGPPGAFDALEIVRSMAMREDVDSDDELSRLDIPLNSPYSILPSLLPASPWSSFRSDRSERSFDDDTIESIPAMITFVDEKPTHKRNSTSSRSYGLHRQLSQDDFLQLQDDLEAALEDFHAVDRVEEPEKKVSIIWAFIIRLAELLYGEPNRERTPAPKHHMGLSKTVEL